MLNRIIAHVTHEARVVEFKSDQDILSDLEGALPEVGTSLNEALDRFWEKALRGCVFQSHPLFLAFPDSGNAIAGLAAELIIPFLNQNLIATKKSAPTATFVELQVLWWMRRLVGYRCKEHPQNAIEASGIMVAGGVAGNGAAMLAARSRAYPSCRKHGLISETAQPSVFIPGDTISHYSHSAAAWWVGLGEDALVPIGVADDYTMDLVDLELKLRQCRARGRRPVAIIAQAGDSRTMAIDHLDKLADLAERHSTWLHVDACHGGSLLFSDRLGGRLQGIERADSVVIDPHKSLCLPYSSSILLFKTPDHCLPLAKSTDITIEEGSYDLGQVTPFVGSRRFESLKLWLLLQHIGRQGVGKMVEYRYELAKYWKQLVDQSNYFVSLNEVSINSVVFSVTPNARPGTRLNAENVSQLNQLIHDKLYEEGKCCVHAFDIRDYAGLLGYHRGTKIRALGITIGNPLTNTGNLDDAFRLVEKHALGIITAEL